MMKDAADHSRVAVVTQGCGHHIPRKAELVWINLNGFSLQSKVQMPGSPEQIGIGRTVDVTNLFHQLPCAHEMVLGNPWGSH